MQNGPIAIGVPVAAAGSRARCVQEYSRSTLSLHAPTHDRDDAPRDKRPRLLEVRMLMSHVVCRVCSRDFSVRQLQDECATLDDTAASQDGRASLHLTDADAAGGFVVKVKERCDSVCVLELKLLELLELPGLIEEIDSSHADTVFPAIAAMLRISFEGLFKRFLVRCAVPRARTSLHDMCGLRRLQLEGYKYERGVDGTWRLNRGGVWEGHPNRHDVLCQSTNPTPNNPLRVSNCTLKFKPIPLCDFCRQPLPPPGRAKGGPSSAPSYGARRPLRLMVPVALCVMPTYTVRVLGKVRGLLRGDKDLGLDTRVIVHRSISKACPKEFAVPGLTLVKNRHDHKVELKAVVMNVEMNVACDISCDVACDIPCTQAMTVGNTVGDMVSKYLTSYHQRSSATCSPLA